MRSYLYLILVFSLGACTQSKYLFRKGKVEPFFTAEKNRAQKSYYLDIPFQLDRGLIFLPVEIGGVTYRFLFDTGAPVVVSTEIAQRNDFKVLKKAWVNDSQGKGRVQNYLKIDQLVLDSLIFENLTAVEVDLAYSPVLSCLGIDGIVGANLMRQGYWQIDFEQKHLRFSNKQDFWDKTQTRHALPFVMKTTGTPVIKLNLGDGTVKAVTFDSGSTGYLALPQKLYGGDEEPVRTSWGYLSSGIFGSRLDTAREHVLDIKLNDSSYALPVKFETEDAGKLLGMSFLKHFLVQLDWEEQMIYLSPRQKIDWEADSSYSIVPHYRDSVLFIGTLEQKALRQFPQLSIGDTITEVNGQATFPLGPLDFCRVLDVYRESGQLELEIKSKGRFTFQRGLRYRRQLALKPRP